MAKYIDWVGFTYNGHHSSDFNIIRTSGGSRFSEDLVPTFSDISQDITGGDGSLYWESNYSTRHFSISIAFDSLSESDFRNMRRWLNGKDVGQLIFDESPYKAYTVKVASPPQLQYICFDRLDTDTPTRVYKGEGTINFVAYYPYGIGTVKYIGDCYVSTGELKEEFHNIREWNGVIDLPSLNSTNNTTKTLDSNHELFNCGDIEMDWEIYINFTNYIIPKFNLLFNNGVVMVVDEIAAQGNDLGVLISSKTHLIEGYGSNGIKTGNLYNRYLLSGDFTKIPVTDDKITINVEEDSSDEDNDTNIPIDFSLEYNYLFF